MEAEEEHADNSDTSSVTSSESGDRWTGFGVAEEFGEDGDGPGFAMAGGKKDIAKGPTRKEARFPDPI